MILVTVGTTMPFDELVAEADRLVGAGVLDEEVVCQSGESAYRTTHCRPIRALPSLEDMLASASLVVTHGGATVIQLLMMKKPFVAFPNPRGAGHHQHHFLERVSTVARISWSTDVADLARLIGERRALGPATVDEGVPRARDIVLAALRS